MLHRPPIFSLNLLISLITLIWNSVSFLKVLFPLSLPLVIPVIPILPPVQLASSLSSSDQKRFPSLITVMSYRKPPAPLHLQPHPSRRTNGDQQQPQVQTPPPWLQSFDDPMDIDSEPSAPSVPSAPRRTIPTGPAAMTASQKPTGGTPFTVTTDGTKVYRHTFEIDISSRAGGVTDLEIIEHARTQMGFLERAGLRDDAMRRIRDCRTRLRVVIDTKSPSRLDALVDARLRMLTMQDMINEGMGWFPGLPWRHHHFRIETFCPRS